MMMLRSTAALLASIVSTAALAWTHGAAVVAGGAIPTIVAGSNQPGSQAGPWINWGPIQASCTDSTACQQGSAGDGFTSNAIADWDVPMYSMQSGTFNICVVGYHVSGSLAAPLAHVTFYLDGGSGVDTPAPNFTKTLSATGKSVPEFCVQATDTDPNIKDGEHEFRAVAYPVRGYPRVMSSSATVAVTSGSANITHMAHGRVDQMPYGTLVEISGSTDPNFVNSAADSSIVGKYCILNWTVNSYQLGAMTTMGAPINNGHLPVCGSTPIVAGSTTTFTVTTSHAGIAQAEMRQGESLFINTNGHGALLPANSVAYADNTSGSAGSDAQTCLDSTTHKCQNIGAALTALVAPSWNTSYTINHLTGQFSNASNTFAVGQAIILLSSTCTNFVNSVRPYYVVAPVTGSNLFLSLTPGGPAISSASCGGGDGSASLIPDLSNFTINLMCSGACSTPTTYALPETGTLAAKANYINSETGWLTIQPLPPTSHANTVLTSGPAYGSSGGFANTLNHITVDVDESATAALDQVQFWFNSQYNWGLLLDTVTASMWSPADKDDFFTAGFNGWQGFINVTTSNGYQIGSGNIVENTTQNSMGGGAAGSGGAQLFLGNNSNVIYPDCCWTFQVGANFPYNAGNHAIVSLGNVTLPPYLTKSTTTGVGGWALFDMYTAPDSTGVSAGSCLGSNGDGDAGSFKITSSANDTPSTITLNVVPNVNTCTTAVYAYLSTLIHGNWLFTRNSDNDSIYGFNVCAVHCSGRGYSTQGPGLFGDTAVIGNDIEGYVANLPANMLGAAMVQLQQNTSGDFIAANKFRNGSIFADTSSWTYSNDYFEGNDCDKPFTPTNAQALGWTTRNGIAAWGGGSGC